MPPTRRKPRRHRGMRPAHAGARRRAREQLATRDRALQAWLALQLAGDTATAHLVWWVGTLHAGVIAWAEEATHAHVLGNGGGMVGLSGTPDPDEAILRALAPNLDAGDLLEVRGLVVAKVGELYGWYIRQLLDARLSSPGSASDARLDGWTGDAEFGAGVARCMALHARLKVAGETSRRKAAEARWRRLAAWYIRLLDGRKTRCDLT
jgi:hypothetical protein